MSLAEVWSALEAEIRKACLSSSVTFDHRAVLACIRDMPYGRPNGTSPHAALIEWRGTCSTKHIAVHEYLEGRGFTPRLLMGVYQIRLDSRHFPMELVSAINGRPVFDVHNYIVCDLGHGEISIDVTFPISWAVNGFITTEAWDGKSSFSVAAGPFIRLEQIQPAECASRKTAALQTINDESAQVLREKFILTMAKQSFDARYYKSRADCIRESIQTCRFAAAVCPSLG